MPSDVEIDEHAALAALAVPLERALIRICDLETDRIRQEISVPVEYDDQGHPIRSEPGEPPRLESSKLHDGVGYFVHTIDGLPEATIYASRGAPEDESHQADAAQVLESGGQMADGSPVAPRPFMGPAAERIQGYAADMTADELRSYE